MNVILGSLHLDITKKRYNLMNFIVLKFKCAGEVWEGNAKLVRKPEPVPITAAREILECSKTARNTALRPELEWYPLEVET